MKKALLFLSIALVPGLAFAQVGDVEDALDLILRILTDTLIPLLIVIATIVFIWGVIRYVTAGGDEEQIKAGRNLMLFGIIALAVIVSVWGIVRVLVDTFGIGGEDIPPGLGTF